MSRKVYYKEKFDDLVMGAKTELTDLIKDALTKIDNDSIEFVDHKIDTPIFRRVEGNDELICNAFNSIDGVKFVVADSYGEEYQISINDIDMHMTLYLLGQFEWFELTYRYEKQYGGKQ